MKLASVQRSLDGSDTAAVPAVDWHRIAYTTLLSRALDDLEENQLVKQKQVLYQFSARGHDMAQAILGSLLNRQGDAACGYYRSRPFMLSVGLDLDDAISEVSKNRIFSRDDVTDAELAAMIEKAAECGAEDEANAIATHDDANPAGAVFFGNDVGDNAHRGGKQSRRHCPASDAHSDKLGGGLRQQVADVGEHEGEQGDEDKRPSSIFVGQAAHDGGGAELAEGKGHR